PGRLPPRRSASSSLLPQSQDWNRIAGRMLRPPAPTLAGFAVLDRGLQTGWLGRLDKDRTRRMRRSAASFSPSDAGTPGPVAGALSWVRVSHRRWKKRSLRRPWFGLSLGALELPGW